MLRVLVILALLALAIYLVVRTVQNGGTPPPLRSHGAKRPRPRPLAPDDDLEFLRDLDRKRKHPDDPENV